MSVFVFQLDILYKTPSAVGIRIKPFRTSQRHVLNNKPLEISDPNPSVLERMLRHTKLFRKYRTKDAAVYGKSIQQQERLMQAQAYISLLPCSAAIWNYFLCLHKSRRHKILYEDYREKGETNKKKKKNIQKAFVPKLEENTPNRKLRRI